MIGLGFRYLEFLPEDERALGVLIDLEPDMRSRDPDAGDLVAGSSRLEFAATRPGHKE